MLGEMSGSSNTTNTKNMSLQKNKSKCGNFCNNESDLRKQVTPLFKSPSDMTIYSPGLKRMSYDPNVTNLNIKLNTPGELSLIDKISNFVEQVRIDGKNETHRDDGREQLARQSPKVVGDTRRVERSVDRNEQSQPQQPQPEGVAEQLLLQAEKF